MGSIWPSQRTNSMGNCSQVFAVIDLRQFTMLKNRINNVKSGFAGFDMCKQNGERACILIYWS
ncbi:MAG: hypothetical protein COA91_07590 [Robiginitomaculum sp.]|nr:MAG: hypothetical protein COA91_07590 [Robiginitomaculum sp.]